MVWVSMNSLVRRSLAASCMDSPPVDRNIPLTPEPGWRRPGPTPPLLQRSSAQDPVSERVLREIVKMPGKIAGHSFCRLNSVRVGPNSSVQLHFRAEINLNNSNSFDFGPIAPGSCELQQQEDLRWIVPGCSNMSGKNPRRRES